MGAALASSAESTAQETAHETGHETVNASAKCEEYWNLYNLSRSSCEADDISPNKTVLCIALKALIENNTCQDHHGTEHPHKETHKETHEEAHHGGDPSIMLFIFMCCIVGALIRTFLKRVPLPYTVVLLFVGVIVGLLARVEEVFRTYTEIAFMDPHLIFHVFLPVLIFESAFSLDVHTFSKVLTQVILLALPGLIISSGLTALLSMYIFNYDWTWKIALMFGAIVSATDPVAVVALLKDLGASKTLAILIEGESLLNDGAAIVIFNVIIDIIIRGDASKYASFSGVALYCASVCFGGPLFGFVIGKITTFWLSMIFNDAMTEITITLGAAYVTFYVGEVFLGVSGVLAVVMLGVVMSAEKTSISPEVEIFLHRFWEMLAYLANTLIFVLVGIVIARRVGDDMEAIDIFYFVTTYIGVNIIRGITIGIFSPILMRLGYGFTWQNGVVMTWAGLRGAVGLTLALLLFNFELDKKSVSSKILFHTAGIVIMTLFLNATTIKWLLKKLGMSDISTPKKMAMQTAVRYLIDCKSKAISILKSDRFLADADWQMVEKSCVITDPYKTDKEESEENVPQEANFYQRVSICPDCETLVPNEPSPQEQREMDNEARLRYLKALKEPETLDDIDNDNSSVSGKDRKRESTDSTLQKATQKLDQQSKDESTEVNIDKNTTRGGDQVAAMQRRLTTEGFESRRSKEPKASEDSPRGSRVRDASQKQQTGEEVTQQPMKRVGSPHSATAPSHPLEIVKEERITSQHIMGEKLASNSSPSTPPAPLFDFRASHNVKGHSDHKRERSSSRTNTSRSGSKTGMHISSSKLGIKKSDSKSGFVTFVKIEREKAKEREFHSGSVSDWPQIKPWTKRTKNNSASEDSRKSLAELFDSALDPGHSSPESVEGKIAEVTSLHSQTSIGRDKEVTLRMSIGLDEKIDITPVKNDSNQNMEKRTRKISILKKPNKRDSTTKQNTYKRFSIRAHDDSPVHSHKRLSSDSNTTAGASTSKRHSQSDPKLKNVNKNNGLSDESTDQHPLTVNNEQKNSEQDPLTSRPNGERENERDAKSCDIPIVWNDNNNSRRRSSIVTGRGAVQSRRSSTVSRRTSILDDDMDKMNTVEFLGPQNKNENRRRSDEVDAIQEESRKRYLNACKVSYWKQFEHGMLSREAVSKLVECADIATDQHGGYMDLREIKKTWQVKGFFSLLKQKLETWGLSRRGPQEHMPRNRFRRLCFIAANHTVFDVFINVVIVANMIPILMELINTDTEYYEKHKEFFDLSNYIFFGIYVMEAMLKMTAYGVYYFLSHWNQLDTLIIILSVVDIVIAEFKGDTQTFAIDPSFLKLARIFKLLRISRLLKLLKPLTPQILNFFNSQINKQLSFGYDVGKGYVSGEDEVNKLIDQMIDHKPIALKLKEISEQGRLEVIRELAMLQREHPGIAVAVKTRQAIRSVLNTIMESLNDLKGDGLLDDVESLKLSQMIELQMKKLLNAPSSIPPPPPENMLSYVSWLEGDQQLINLVKDRAKLISFNYGDIIMTIGDKCNGIYIIVSGLVRLEGNHGYNPVLKAVLSRVSVDSDPDDEPENIPFMDFLTAGKVIGEMSILTQEPRNATVTCETAVQCYFIHIDDCVLALKMFQDEPSLEKRLWTTVAKRIAGSLMSSDKNYTGWTRGKIKMHLQNAYVPNLADVVMFNIDSSIKDVFLIQGFATELPQKIDVVGPVMITKMSNKLMLYHQEKPKIVLLIVPNEGIGPAATQTQLVRRADSRGSIMSNNPEPPPRFRRTSDSGRDVRRESYGYPGEARLSRTYGKPKAFG